MTFSRNFWWSAVVLAAFAGCGNEQTTTETPAPATTTMPAPSPTSTPAPAAGTDEMKGPAAKPDASKDDMPKDGTSTTEKKDGDLKLDAPATPTPAKSDENKTEDKKDEKKSDDKTAAAGLSGDELAEIKKLPDDEQKLALAQAVCPVSEEKLGSMGKPVKVSAEGKTFYLCCKGCKKDVDADPKAVLAKLVTK